MHTPESRLAMAVLTRALEDLTLPHATAQAECDRTTARGFLTGDEWKPIRRFWCAAAGIDEDYLRRKLMERPLIRVERRGRHRDGARRHGTGMCDA